VLGYWIIPLMLLAAAALLLSFVRLRNHARRVLSR
jgi:hypothetical protein